MNDKDLIYNDERFNLSLSLSEHPMRNLKKKLQIDYYHVLSYFIIKIRPTEITQCRLEQYKSILNPQNIAYDSKKKNKAIASIISCHSMYWRDKYRYFLLTDIALILQDYDKIKIIYQMVTEYLSKNQILKYNNAFKVLFDDKESIDNYPFEKAHILQYHKNSYHKLKQTIRIVVTANMSAGKSTFINSLIGKSIIRTSQEVCTGNISYIKNKSFDDGAIYIYSDELNMNATRSELSSFSWDKPTHISSYFYDDTINSFQACIIDTPGVNSSINRHHGRITKEFLRTDDYDKIIYVLNANKLGTDEEISYLNWISKNVNKNKVIFILNKIDDFNLTDDSISYSINEVKNDLIKAGFESPVVCPISSYFALLSKMKHNGITLSEDEKDEYEIYIKKFNKPEYNLLNFYSDIKINGDESEELLIEKQCGLYGVKKQIFGGIL